MFKKILPFLGALLCLLAFCGGAGAQERIYNISVSVYPEGAEVGTAEGAGTYAEGDTVTLRAYPAGGYVFTAWKEDGRTVGTAMEMSFPAESDRHITANFESTPGEGRCLISASAIPFDGGTVTGAGIYRTGSSVRLTAYPAAGWRFDGWQESSKIVSLSSVYNITCDSDRSYGAIFVKDEEPSESRFRLKTEVYPSGAGTVEGGGYYESGDTVTLTPTAAAGWRFDHWEEGGYRRGSDPTYTVTIHTDRTVTASFVEDGSTEPSGGNSGGDAPEQGKGLQIHLQASPEGAGTLSGAGSYNKGDTAVLKASPASGYTFYGWRLGGKVVSTSAEYRATVDSSAWYTAIFKATVNIESLKISGLPAGNELTTGQTAALSVETVPAGAAGDITWSSSDPSVVFAGSAGTIKGMKPGYATVTATCGKATDSVVITVYDAAQSPDTPQNPNQTDTPTTPDTPAQSPDVHISTSAVTGLPSTLRLTTVYGGTGFSELTASLLPSTSTDGIIWSSSAPSVAKVAQTGARTARVEAVAEGEAVISAVSGPVTKRINVSVSDRKFTMDNMMLIPRSPDAFGVQITGINANPAMTGSKSVDHVSVFAWSDPDQRDLQAVRATVSGGAWTADFAVNGPAWFSNADDIHIHAYASSAASGDECFLGAGSYKAVNRSTAGSKSVVYSAYAQNIGFITPASTTGLIAGTTGQARQLEGIRASSNVDNLKINTSVHCEDLGWLPYAADGVYAGTTGQNRQIEAVRFKLSGANAAKYYVRYRVHCADTGWTRWTASTESAEAFSGTTGQHRRIEAVQVQILAR